MQSSSGIGPLVHIIGTVSSEEPLIIAGRVTGPIDVAGDVLTIARGARVDGDITADAVVIGGEVRGHVLAATRIAVDDTAAVEGSLSAPALALALGAVVQGEVAVEGRHAASLRLAS